MSDNTEFDVRSATGETTTTRSDRERPGANGGTIDRAVSGDVVTSQSQSNGDSQPRVRMTRRPASALAPKPIRKSVAREYFESAVVTFVMALFGMTFIVQAVKVPTGSMKNTIYIGDHLLVNKFIFGENNGLRLPVGPARLIRRGDVLVFKYPKDPQVNYVKRVIGLPGDTIEFDQETDRVYINGKELPEHKVTTKPQFSLRPDDPAPLEIKPPDPGSPPGAWYTVFYQDGADSLGPRARYAVGQPFRIPRKGDLITDPEILNDKDMRQEFDQDGDGRYDSDQFFCMGDNRDNSEDSRFWGTVPRSNVVGRAMFVYWSLGDGNGSRNPLVDFLTGTRWSRSGKFIK
ncbi:MAG TPA: signal peptidase I [Blastocatellia bacterium]|nr:signal peptidase I [Blastocatellia bacterium]